MDAHWGIMNVAYISPENQPMSLLAQLGNRESLVYSNGLFGRYAPVSWQK